MKISIIDDDNIIVFLNSIYVKKIDFNNKEDIEKNFRDLFLKLKYIYNLDIKGYYNINIYVDKIYGAILEIEHEDIEYFDYFENKVDMRVNVVSNTNFLYKIKDPFTLTKDILDNSNIYSFKNKLYLLLRHPLSFHKLGFLLEVGELVYGSKADDILKIGYILNK